MIIHLKHPQHGEKFAYSEQEAEMDKQNGWEEVKHVDHKLQRTANRRQRNVA